MVFLLDENEAEPFGGEGGLFLTLYLNRNIVLEQELAWRLFIGAGECEMSTHSAA
jgi:hypothetical protein